VKLNVVPVSPAMSVHVVPPLLLLCHLTVGGGEPVAVEVKLAVLPAVTVESEGVDDTVMVGSVSVTEVAE
jgi:hypothetical protein